MMTLESSLLLKYADTFYGYGNYAGPIWFIGLEEGGGDNFEEVADKVTLWDTRGAAEIDDLRQHHHNSAPTSPWFRRYAKLQRTWARLIRVLLADSETSPSRDQLLSYQREHLGRSDSDHCLLELFPLPSPRNEVFTYAKHFTLDHLQSRKKYELYYAPRRIKHIQQRIDEYRPPCVVLYGLKVHRWWEQHAGTQLRQSQEPGICIARRGDTHFVAVEHPVAYGVPNAYFDSVGKYIKAIAPQCFHDKSPL